MNPRYHILKLLILIIIQECSSNSAGFYGTCNTSFSCGTISGFQYPFRRHQDPTYCGYPGFELNSCEDQNLATINIMNITYKVLGMDPTAQILKIVREDMINSMCPQELVNTTIDPKLFDYTKSYMNISILFGCPLSFNLMGIGSIFCADDELSQVFLVPGIQGPGNCETSVVIPFPVEFLKSDVLGRVFQKGFDVIWKVEGSGCGECIQSGGQCIYDHNTVLTMCACPKSPFLADSCSTVNKTDVNASPFVSTSTSSGSSSKKSVATIVAVVGAIVAAIGIGIGIFVCRQRRKRIAIRELSPSHTETKAILTTVSNYQVNNQVNSGNSNFTSSIPSYPSSKTSNDFGKSSYFGAQVFSYEELEVATDNFNNSRELGDGGFGAVYYGKLIDGREVAVKRLYENNFKRVEQFMNEVEILTKLNHENLVKLYGCSSKHSKELLLVYEYIPNGTVADHLHGKLSTSTSTPISWPLRLNIAIETAEALAYLHKSDVIHRDVKTTNILLDKTFKVKVADFGLSRLFPNDATHVSTAPQGTPGYVDPEYYQCYQLTDKSDVYSFGVVLTELLSSLQAVDTSRHRLDINLANMAVVKIQNHLLGELVDKSVGFESDGMVKRMMTLVAELAFRCLQQEKDLRPTMKEVVEVLRGIQNDEMNAQKPEVVDIVVDGGGVLKDC